MEEKVDLLISQVENLKELLKKVGVRDFNILLNEACFCLKSHDLIGLKFILDSLNNEKFERINDSEIQKLALKIFNLVKTIKEEFTKDTILPTASEELFLNLSYNKFFDIIEEMDDEKFWAQSPQYRLGKITQTFSIYTEILNYTPFKGVFEWVAKYRPPMESEIAGPLFKFIRNVLAHFPFYDSWDEIWLTKDLVNWHKPNQSIDKFLEKYKGKPEVKYRFIENSKENFTYITIKFPENYNTEKIYLKSIIEEEQGIKFAIVMMIRILNTQIESIK